MYETKKVFFEKCRVGQSKEIWNITKKIKQIRAVILEK